jgi:imidazolonepropionase-like amidohydrolase
VTVTAVRAPLAWLGPGQLVEDVLVVMDRARVLYAGSARGRESAVIASHDGRVESLSGQPLPPEPEVEIRVDGFVMPGVVDRHVHIGLSDPGLVVAGGVTAVRDLGWPPEVSLSLADASESPSFTGPLIRAAGPIITSAGGYPTRAGWGPKGTGAEVRGPDEAAGLARDLLDRGAAVLKVALNSEAGPTLSDEELVAVCDVAHARDTIVTVHAQGKGQAARAAGAGVDEFAHCPWSERLPDDLIGAMAKRMRIISTLDIHSHGKDTPELRTAIDNLARFVAAGGRVAYGTDLGNGPIPAGIHVGEAWHLRRAGLTPDQVLEALTFRRLSEGEPADLIALAGNPLEDLNALAEIRLVIRTGRRIR